MIIVNNALIFTRTCSVSMRGTPRLPISFDHVSHSKAMSTRDRSRFVCQSTDYIAASSDEGILRLPPRTEITAEQLFNVFGYPRDIDTHYTVGRVVGAGSFGVVRQCVEKSSGRRLAVKSIPKVPKRGACTPRYLLKLRAEVELMQQLGFSLDAVNLKDVYEDMKYVHLIMDLCEGDGLLERVSAGRHSEKQVARLMRGVLRFVSQCHAKGIIYRDVKPDNFLFVTKDSTSLLKAIDFGLAIRHWPWEKKLTSRSGTPAYMAPELIQQHYTEKCDIWGVGMLTYQVLTGTFPFWEDVRHRQVRDVWNDILEDEIDWSSPDVARLSPSAVDFLQQLLQKRPEQRPSAPEALQHPWIRDEGAAGSRPLAGSVVQRLQRFSTYGHLKQAILSIIMDEVAEHPHAALASVNDLHELFEELDTDANGCVSLEELTEGLRKQGYSLSNTEIEQLLRGVDANHDGSIVLSEFMSCLIDWDAIQREQQWQGYLDYAFAKIDTDGDGYLSLREILALLPREEVRSGDPHAADAEIRRMREAHVMLREADENDDGRISKEEFYHLLRDNKAPPDPLGLYDHRLSRP